MWKLRRQTVYEDFETPELKAVEGNKINLVRVKGQRLPCIVCSSPVVSRNHCQLEYRNGDWFVTDFESMNGTYINGDKIEPSEIKSSDYKYFKIEHGDTLGLGVDVVPPKDLVGDDRKQEDFFVFKFVNLAREQDCAKTAKEVAFDIVTISDSEDEEKVKFIPKKVESRDSGSDDPIILDEPSVVIPSVTKPVPHPSPVSRNYNQSSKLWNPDRKSSIEKPNRPGPASWKNSQQTGVKNSNAVSPPVSTSTKRKQESTPLISKKELKRRRVQESDETSRPKDVISEKEPHHHDGNESLRKSKKSRNDEISTSKRNFVVYSSDDESSTDSSVASVNQSTPYFKDNPQLRGEVSVLLGRSVFVDSSGVVGWDETEMQTLELSMENMHRIERQLLLRKFGHDYYKPRESHPSTDQWRDEPESESRPKFGFSSANAITYEPSPNSVYKNDIMENKMNERADENSTHSSSESEGEYAENEDMPDDAFQEDSNNWISVPKKPRRHNTILIAPSSTDPSKRKRQKAKQAVTSFPSPARRMSPSKLKARAQMLRKIALEKKAKESIEKKVTFDIAKTEHNEAPKVKYTKQSRSDKLADDLISDSKEPVKVPDIPKTTVVETTTASTMQMPVNKIVSESMNSTKHTVHIYREPQPQVRQQPSMKNLMHKGSTYQPTKDFPRVRNPPNPPGCSKTVEEKSKRPFTSSKPVIKLEQAYKDILHWNPKWLEEQKNFKNPPHELLGSRKLVSVVDEYVKYEDYAEIFYPLLMMEFWRCLCADYVGNKGLRRSNTHGGKPPSYTFSVGVENVHSDPHCPFTVAQDARQQPPVNTEGGVPSDYVWTRVFCHGFSAERNALDRNLDFGVVTLHFSIPDEFDKPSLMNRKCFTIIQNGDTIAVDAKTSVHKGLYENMVHGGESTKFKSNYTLHVRMKQEEVKQISVEHVGELRKISYVAPRLRDFKSVLTLHESPLFEKILTPSLDYPIFDSSRVTAPHPAALIATLANKLNTVQKFVVHSASIRILENPKPEVMLLHGPPGTGKTAVIVSLIVQIIKGQRSQAPQPRLLVCTPSNTAINEIIFRVEKFFKDNYSGQRMPVIIRIGNEVGYGARFSLDRMAEEQCKQPTAYDSITKQIDDLTEQIKVLEVLINENTSRKQDTTTLKNDLDECKKRRHNHEQDLREAKANRPQRKEVEAEKYKILMEANIIFGTLGSCSGFSLLHRHFGRHRREHTEKPKITACIIDEATQATEPECLAPLLLDVTKLLLVGDPMQLHATVISQEAASKYYGESLFTRHFNFYKKKFPGNKPSPVMYLEQQYRMHPDILSWPNKKFYDSKLKTPSNIAIDRQNKLRLEPYVFVNFDGVESKGGIDGKISNADEVKLIVDILKTINMQHNVCNTRPGYVRPSIGVITPYREQKREILETLGNKSSPESQLFQSMKIEVDTIDSYQGREKDILILSCVRSEGVGFLTDPKRLCVALTRARCSLIIIGKADCLKSDSKWSALISDAKSRTKYRNIPKDYYITPSDSRRFIERAILATEQKSLIPEESRLEGYTLAHLREL